MVTNLQKRADVGFYNQDESKEDIINKSDSLDEENTNSDSVVSVKNKIEKRRRVYFTLNNGPRVLNATQQEWDQFLLKISVAYLREMKEHCHEKKLERSRLEAFEKQDEAKKAFEAFIRAAKVKQKFGKDDAVIFTSSVDENTSGNRAYSYDRWKTKKEMISAAQGALKYINHPADIETWIKIGKNLKAVDQSLYQSWFNWGNVASGDKMNSRTLWDFFEPRYCDVHYGASVQEGQQCLYQTTCSLTGMHNAYTLLKDDTLLEAPERKRRLSILKHYCGNEYDHLLGSNCVAMRQPVSTICLSEGSIKSEEALSVLRKLCHEVCDILALIHSKQHDPPLLKRSRLKNLPLI